MFKIGDMFGTEAYLDTANGNKILFVFEEQNEEFIYDLDKDFLKEGEDDSFTWEIASTWLDEYKDTIIEMLKTGDIHYINDPEY